MRHLSVLSFIIACVFLAAGLIFLFGSITTVTHMWALFAAIGIFFSALGLLLDHLSKHNSSLNQKP